MEKLSFAIIGAGNMGSAIAEGFLKTGRIHAQQIFITDLRSQVLESFRSRGLRTGSDNCEAVATADLIILAVKPYLVKTVLEEIRPVLKPGSQMLLSIAAGIRIAEIESVTGAMPVFRIIPNTAISIQESMSCISAANVTDSQKDTVIEIFSLLGETVFLEEPMIDAATALGSCGTGFAMRYIRASVEGGVEIGFKPQVAQQIVAQTMLGAAKLLLTGQGHPEAEIDKVTTPKGSTIAGLNEMEHHGFTSAVIRGLLASYHKIIGN